MEKPNEHQLRMPWKPSGTRPLPTKWDKAQSFLGPKWEEGPRVPVSSAQPPPEQKGRGPLAALQPLQSTSLSVWGTESKEKFGGTLEARCPGTQRDPAGEAPKHTGSSQVPLGSGEKRGPGLRLPTRKGAYSHPSIPAAQVRTPKAPRLLLPGGQAAPHKTTCSGRGLDGSQAQPWLPGPKGCFGLPRIGPPGHAGAPTGGQSPRSLGPRAATPAVRSRGTGGGGGQSAQKDGGGDWGAGVAGRWGCAAELRRRVGEGRPAGPRRGAAAGRRGPAAVWGARPGGQGTGPGAWETGPVRAARGGWRPGAALPPTLYMLAAMSGGGGAAGCAGGGRPGKWRRERAGARRAGRRAV